MPHARQLVRAAAESDLTGLATTGGSVFVNRLSPFKAEEVPALNIQLLDESSGWDSIGTVARTGRLIVEGWLAREEDELLDDLDTVAAEIEAAVYAGAGAGALSALLMNIDTPTTQIDLPDGPDRGAKRLGVVRMLFPVTYRTRQGDPTTIV